MNIENLELLRDEVQIWDEGSPERGDALCKLQFEFVMHRLEQDKINKKELGKCLEVYRDLRKKCYSKYGTHMPSEYDDQIRVALENTGLGDKFSID